MIKYLLCLLALTFLACGKADVPKVEIKPSPDAVKVVEVKAPASAPASAPKPVIKTVPPAKAPAVVKAPSKLPPPPLKIK